MLNLYPLDYQEVNFQVEEKYVLPSHVRLTEAEKKKIPDLQLALKNAIFHHILQNRKNQRLHNLTKILEKAKQAQKAKKEGEVTFNKEMESLGLVQRLENKEVVSNRIQDENFSKLKKIGSVLGKQMLIDIQKDFNRLNYLMQD